MPATFLDRVYINTFSTLAVGKARYGLMLREDGMVYDDGTTSRLAEDHYFLTTTTAKAGPVMQHLEFCRQVLWPELDVQLTSVTDQWAQFSIAGPKHARPAARDRRSRRKTCPTKAFPFMGAREVRAARRHARRGCSASPSPARWPSRSRVPARFGDALARNLMVAGEQFGVTPYGTEALGVMRIEKGHVAGPELNGTTTAGDLGLGKMMSTKKDFIGRVMAGREALVAPDRQVVVGIRPVDTARRLRSGAHIIPKGAAPGPDTDQGYVTSVCFSPMLDQWIGLGLVAARPRAHRRDRPRRTIRCAARTTRSSSAIPSSTIRKEGASVAEPAWTAAGPGLRCRPLRQAAGEPGVRLAVVGDIGLFQVMARRGEWPAAALLRKLLRRPASECRVSFAPDVTLVWSGPDQFLALLASTRPRGGTPARLRGIASLSDQSHGRVVPDRGTESRRDAGQGVVARARPARSGGAMTSIDHTGVTLWRESDDAGGSVYNLLVFTSFAGTLWRLLVEFGRPIRRGIDEPAFCLSVCCAAAHRFLDIIEIRPDIPVRQILCLCKP